MLTALTWFFPYTLDDYAWGTSVGLEGLTQRDSRITAGVILVI